MANDKVVIHFDDNSDEVIARIKRMQSAITNLGVKATEAEKQSYKESVSEHSKAERQKTTEAKKQLQEQIAARRAANSQFKSYEELEAQYSRVKTKKLIDDTQQLVVMRRKAEEERVRAITKGDALEKASAEGRLTAIKQEIASMRLLSIQREEVQKKGAGVLIGQLGLFREMREQGGLGKAVLGGLAGGAAFSIFQQLPSLISNMRQLAGETDTAADSISVALSRTGKSMAFVRAEQARMIEGSKSIADAFAMDRFEVNKLQAEIVGFSGITGPLLDHLTEIAIGASQQLQMAPEQLARILARALNGDTEARLGRISIHFDKGATAAEKLAIIEKKLGGSIQAAKDAADDSYGAFDRMKNKLHEAAAEFAAKEFEKLAPIFKDVSDNVEGLFSVLDKGATFLGRNLDLYGRLIVMLGGAAAAFKVLSLAMAGSPLGLTITLMGGLVAAIGALRHNALELHDAIADARSEQSKINAEFDKAQKAEALAKEVDDLAKKYDTLSGKTNKTAKDNKDLNEVQVELAVRTKGVAGQINKLGEAYDFSIGKARQFAADQRNVASSLKDTAREALEARSALLQAKIEENRKSLTELEQDKQGGFFSDLLFASTHAGQTFSPETWRKNRMAQVSKDIAQQNADEKEALLEQANLAESFINTLDENARKDTANLTERLQEKFHLTAQVAQDVIRQYNVEQSQTGKGYSMPEGSGGGANAGKDNKDILKYLYDQHEGVRKLKEEWAQQDADESKKGYQEQIAELTNEGNRMAFIYDKQLAGGLLTQQQYEDKRYESDHYFLSAQLDLTKLALGEQSNEYKTLYDKLEQLDRAHAVKQAANTKADGDKVIELQQSLEDKRTSLIKDEFARREIEEDLHYYRQIKALEQNISDKNDLLKAEQLAWEGHQLTLNQIAKDKAEQGGAEWKQAITSPLDNVAQQIASKITDPLAKGLHADTNIFMSFVSEVLSGMAKIAAAKVAKKLGDLIFGSEDNTATPTANSQGGKNAIDLGKMLSLFSVPSVNDSGAPVGQLGGPIVNGQAVVLANPNDWLIDLSNNGGINPAVLGADGPDLTRKELAGQGHNSESAQRAAILQKNADEERQQAAEKDAEAQKDRQEAIAKQREYWQSIKDQKPIKPSGSGQTNMEALSSMLGMSPAQQVSFLAGSTANLSQIKDTVGRSGMSPEQLMSQLSAGSSATTKAKGGLPLFPSLLLSGLSPVGFPVVNTLAKLQANSEAQRTVDVNTSAIGALDSIYGGGAGAIGKSVTTKEELKEQFTEAVKEGIAEAGAGAAMRFGVGHATVHSIAGDGASELDQYVAHTAVHTAYAKTGENLLNLSEANVQNPGMQLAGLIPGFNLLAPLLSGGNEHGDATAKTADGANKATAAISGLVPQLFKLADVGGKADKGTKKTTDALGSLFGIGGSLLNIFAPGSGTILSMFGGLFGSFDSGGYTGAGATNTAAGIVHRGEYVVDRQNVNRLGGPNSVRALLQGGGASYSVSNNAEVVAEIRSLRNSINSQKTVLVDRTNLRYGVSTDEHVSNALSF